MSGPSRDAAGRKGVVNQRPHVVVITDDADLRDYLTQGLLFAGFWTSAIASGLQAIEVFRLRRFDLILLDGDLRGLSALEVARRLRRGTGEEGAPLTSAPIVMVDAAESPDQRAELRSVGVESFLDPPLELETVASTLMEIVGRWRADHPDEPWADAPLPQSRGPRGDGMD